MDLFLRGQTLSGLLLYMENREAFLTPNFRVVNRCYAEDNSHGKKYET
jgi:hypothetical protein